MLSYQSKYTILSFSSLDNFFVCIYPFESDKKYTFFMKNKLAKIDHARYSPFY